MSTSFHVYPGNEYLPTFSELLNVAIRKVNDFLKELNCKQSVIISVEIRQNKDHILEEFNLNDELVWSDDSYAWFFINGVDGGTDAYYEQIDEIDKEAWEDEIEINLKAQNYRRKISRSIGIGYYWIFRRSIGQPALINLAYGLLAASLAQITEGYIYSDDGAWDYKYFPASSDEFFSWYFKPEYTDENKSWIQESIDSIINEFN